MLFINWCFRITNKQLRESIVLANWRPVNFSKLCHETETLIITTELVRFLTVWRSRYHFRWIPLSSGETLVHVRTSHVFKLVCDSFMCFHVRLHQYQVYFKAVQSDSIDSYLTNENISCHWWCVSHCCGFFALLWNEHGRSVMQSY